MVTRSQPVSTPIMNSSLVMDVSMTIRRAAVTIRRALVEVLGVTYGGPVIEVGVVVGVVFVVYTAVGVGCDVAALIAPPPATRFGQRVRVGIRVGHCQGGAD